MRRRALQLRARQRVAPSTAAAAPADLRAVAGLVRDDRVGGRAPLPVRVHVHTDAPADRLPRRVPPLRRGALRLHRRPRAVRLDLAHLRGRDRTGGDRRRRTAPQYFAERCFALPPQMLVPPGCTTSGSFRRMLEARGIGGPQAAPDLNAGKVLIGTPDQVGERLVNNMERCGAGIFMGMFQVGDMPHAKVMQLDGAVRRQGASSPAPRRCGRDRRLNPGRLLTPAGGCGSRTPSRRPSCGQGPCAPPRPGGRPPHPAAAARCPRSEPARSGPPGGPAR